MDTTHTPNQLQLTCAISRAIGGIEYSTVQILPDEMMSLAGKSVKIDGEIVRFKAWNDRVYANCRSWTLGYFTVSTWNLSWGNPQVAQLQGDKPSPRVAKAVQELLHIESTRIIDQ